jgi:hypothetical protein
MRSVLRSDVQPMGKERSCDKRAFAEVVDSEVTLPAPTNPINPGSVGKDASGEVLRSTGHSVLAESL